MKTLNHEAKMTAARTASKIVEIIEYGLTMLGGLTQGLTITFEDDQWITTGCLLSTSILEELHTSTCHRVRGAAIAGVTNFINDDVADVFTKPLSLQQHFSLMLRFWIFLAKRGFSSKPGGEEQKHH